MFSSALSAQLRNQPFIKAAGFSKPGGVFRSHPACSPFLTRDCARDTLPAHLLVLPCPAGLPSYSGLSPLPWHGHRDTTSRPLPRHENRSRLLLCFRRDQGLLLPKEPLTPCSPPPQSPLTCCRAPGHRPLHARLSPAPGEHRDSSGTPGQLWDTRSRLCLSRARCVKAGAGTGQGQGRDNSG